MRLDTQPQQFAINPETKKSISSRGRESARGSRIGAALTWVSQAAVSPFRRHSWAV